MFLASEPGPIMPFRWLAVLALFVSTGCGDASVIGGTPDPTPDPTPGPAPPAPGLPEDHPPSSGAAYEWTRVAWSGSGELAYVGADSMTALALNPATGATRVLYSAAPARIYQVELSADGTEAFTVSGPESVFPGKVPATIRRHKGDTPEVITERFLFTSDPRYGGAIRVSASGDYAYIVGTDSLFLKGTASGAGQLLGTGCFSILAIAPTGDGVICGGGARYSKTGRQATITSSYPRGAGLAVVWSPAGIFLLSDPDPPACVFIVCTKGSERYALEKHSDPSAQFLTPTYPYPETTNYTVSLSANGHSFGYANHYAPNQNTIYLADAATQSVQRIAVHSSVISVSVSPDGSRIAYLAKGQLYVVTKR